jgi:hypothetical protein
MTPLRLTDSQLSTVLHAGASLPPEKHSTYLERIAAYLRQIGYTKVRDVDVERAIQRAIQGLVHAPAA